MRFLVLLAALILAAPAWGDSDPTRVWTKSVDSTDSYDGPPCESSTTGTKEFFVKPGQECFYAFGTGTLHTTAGGSPVLNVQSVNGAMVCFDPDAASTSSGQTLTGIYRPVADGDDTGSMEWLNGDLDGTDCFYAPPGPLYVNHPASSTAAIVHVLAL